MITNGIADWAVWRPGPPGKVFPAVNQMQGLVCHSAEGYNAGNFGELDKPERQASWHFTNSLDGTFYQHYPITASCWTSGNYEANTRYFAVESEGQASVDGPLNDAQVRNLMRLAADLVPVGVTLTRDPATRTLWEHNEVATRWSPNAGPTACPSHRYDPFFTALEGGTDMDPRVDALIAALGGQAEIDKWNGPADAPTGNSLLAGYALEQQKLAEHIAAPHAAGGPRVTTIPTHKHTPGEVIQ